MAEVESRTRVSIDSLFQGMIVSGRVVDSTLILTTESGADVPSGTVGFNFVQTGTIVAFAGATAPTAWLICDGSAVSRVTYATLFATIGVAFGAGDGSTTFNLPDGRGRTLIGTGTGDAAGATAHPLGQKSGEETHKLTVAEMPTHNHSSDGDTYRDQLAGANSWITPSGSGSRWFNTPRIGGYSAPNSGDAGGDGLHNNMQPSLATNYIIYTGSSGAIGSDGSTRSASTPLAVTVPANSQTNATFALSKSYRLLAMTVSSACRVRLYATAANRTGDASRLPGTDPIDGAGVMFDFNATHAGTYNLSPTVDGSSMETTPSANIAGLVDNYTAGALTVNVSFVYQVTER